MLLGSSVPKKESTPDLQTQKLDLHLFGPIQTGASEQAQCEVSSTLESNNLEGKNNKSMNDGTPEGSNIKRY